ncbi:MAG: zinc ABC transporter substrate-binding protein [Candidatus Latescibacteria bacterium]|nr:zinc ABC transporter substrate-binding protein [Candidatus Latescibacterota bacterium]
MRRIFFALVVAVGFVLAGRAEAKKIHVVTTTPDLAAIARAVGGERVEVKAIARGDQDPHYLEAKPSYMSLVNKADLLIYNGLELEIGWLPLLIQGGRNPKVLSGQPGNLEASAGISVLELPSGEVDRSQGDVHPLGNPHYTLDPRNGLVIAQTIATRLQALDPGDAQTFSRNLKQFEQDLQQHLAQWEMRAKDLRGRRVVTYHKNLEYLANWLGLVVADYLEDKPGVPPSPRHIAELVGHMKRDNLAVILYANFQEAMAPERVASQANALALALPISVGGEPGIITYADLFETILGCLEKGFGGF